MVRFKALAHHLVWMRLASIHHLLGRSLGLRLARASVASLAVIFCCPKFRLLRMASATEASHLSLKVKDKILGTPGGAVRRRSQSQCKP